MKPGVYISKTPLPALDLVSRGDYTNPLSEVFQLKDTEQTISKVKSLYVIVYDISIQFFELKILGERTGVRIKLSMDGTNWYDRIYYPYPINAFGAAEEVNFYMGIFFDDFLSLYNMYNLSQITNFKLELIYQ